MKLSTTLPLFLAALAAAAPIEEIAEADTPPSGVYIKKMTANGSGCPAGSYESIISDDKKVITVIFSQYVANIGPGSQVGDNRKNCQVNLKLNYPSGYQYSVVGVTTRGYADLQKDVTATISSLYYFSGQSQQTSARATINGPYSNSYTKTDNIDVRTTVWSPCDTDGMANINTSIMVSKPGGSQYKDLTGSVGVDSIDTKIDTKVKVTFTYELQWKKTPDCRTRSRNTDAAPETSQDMVIADSTIQI